MNKTKRPYSGIFLTDCVVQDNLRTYEQMLEERPYDKRIQREVDFHRKFPAGTKHTRLVAHRIQIYYVQDWKWYKIGRTYSIPKGNLEKIVDVDFGLTLRTSKASVREEVIEKNVTHYNKDGTFIRGDKVKLVSEDGELQTLNNYIDLWHDVKEMEFRNKSGFQYSFGIRKEKLRADLASGGSPKEVHITQYSLIDSQPFGEGEIFVVMMAKHEKNKRIHFLQRKYSINK